ncbi:MAG: hypothetical protein IJO40_08750 [Thermoguttaceae bacterium]|nr:hypothetical protein [Thermoguttaceae bacterium]
MIFRNRGRFVETDWISNGERNARDVGERNFRKVRIGVNRAANARFEM